MSKELTPLEALKEIEQYNFGGIKDFSKHIAIIKTALKDYEKYVNTPALFCGMERSKTQKIIDELSHHKEVKITNLIDERKVRAFEIIKEHITSVSFKYGGILGNVIKLKIDCDTCYIHFNEDDKNFDLLKEVLNYGK